jgi:hypothetical protein
MYMHDEISDVAIPDRLVSGPEQHKLSVPFQGYSSEEEEEHRVFEQLMEVDGPSGQRLQGQHSPSDHDGQVDFVAREVQSLISSPEQQLQGQLHEKNDLEAEVSLDRAATEPTHRRAAAAIPLNLQCLGLPDDLGHDLLDIERDEADDFFTLTK